MQQDFVPAVVLRLFLQLINLVSLAQAVKEELNLIIAVVLSVLLQDVQEAFLVEGVVVTGEMVCPVLALLVL